MRRGNIQPLNREKKLYSSIGSKTKFYKNMENCNLRSKYNGFSEKKNFGSALKKSVEITKFTLNDKIFSHDITPKIQKTPVMDSSK